MTAPLATRTVNADANGGAAAARCLAAGGLVAFPTETVYGLGADATNGQAVARLYEAKGRPSFNPLIAHVADLVAAQALANLNADATRLASKFWPGPLTLVLGKALGCPVAALATAGLDTIAVRVPDHPVARDILSRFGKPIVAPSANRSGHVSPTDARHVLADLGGRIDLIVDAGPTPIGIESTIVACLDGPTLLRPGALPREAIERMLGRALLETPSRARLRHRRTARARHARLALCAAHAVAAPGPARRAGRSAARLRAEACRGTRECSFCAQPLRARRPDRGRGQSVLADCARSTPPAPRRLPSCRCRATVSAKRSTIGSRAQRRRARPLRRRGAAATYLVSIVRTFTMRPG